MRLVSTFVLVLLGLSLPFWIAGARTKEFLAPGLPVSALMAVCPLIAAVAVTALRDPSRVGRLLRQPFDYSKIRAARWVLLALTLKPSVMVLSYVLMCRAGTRVPIPDYGIATVFTVCATFFIAAVAEETGWTGLATQEMMRAYRPARVAIMVGSIWAVWHFGPLWQADRSATWIAWHAAETIASRALIVWLYASSGQCVSVAVLYHTADNVSWLLFPQWGSHYRPEVTAPLTVVAAVAAFAVSPVPPIEHPCAS